MARLAALRSTHLTRDEIAVTALRQFDELATDPTVRGLAAELGVTPTAIYYHYPSQAALFQRVVELVWNQATLGLLDLVPDPFTADPVDVLVATGLATRRTWMAHHRVARYMAATPEANRFVNETVGIMAGLFERLGLDGYEAVVAFHSYSSFMIGAVLFAADRKTANEQLDARPDASSDRIASYDGPGESLRGAFEEVMALSVIDPVRDEELFEIGLRRLVTSMSRG
jgi:AcrR family transcriptional regulator